MYRFYGPMGDLTGAMKKKRIDENREVLKLTAQYIKLKIKQIQLSGDTQT